MSDIKAVVFDMGGVLVKFKHYDKFLDFMKAAKDDVEKREKFMAFEKGTVSAESLLSVLDEVFKPEVELDDLENAVFSRFMGERDEHIYSAIENLKKNGIKVGLLTNNGYWTDLKQRSTILDGCYELFDEVVESCRVNCRKPEKEIYQIMLNKLQLQPHECVFIDDLEHNVKAAEALGFTGITLTDQDGKAVVDKLEKIINLKLY
ncbi:Bifunctional epoxide hydrolase 2 [Aphelenchoides bicaudatus]|nr:Bifunctional epoxide hydrolase 2 [Aphelenchoides bicaudatus]